MLTKSYTCFSALLLFTMALIIAGCSGSSTSTSQSGQGSISAKLVWSGNKTTAKSVASAPAGVATVRLAISGSGMTTMQQDFPAADGSGTLFGIPAGSGLTLTAYGLDGSGTITHQGSVVNVAVSNGLTTDVGAITMLSVGTIAGTYTSNVIGGSGNPVTITMIIADNGVVTGFDSQGASISGVANTQTGTFATTVAATVQNGNTPVYLTGTINMVSGAFTGTFSTTPSGGTTQIGTFSGNRTVTTTYSNASLNGPWLLLLPDGTAHDYFTFNGNGLSIDSSTYNQLTGSYIVQTSGNYTLNTPRTNAATEYASGTLNSSTTGSFVLGVDSNGPAGVYSIVKVSNPAACQGAWNATLVETLGGATYDIAYAVDVNGAISSFTGFTGPVTGHMYSEAGMLSSFFTTGQSDEYNQFAIWGSLSGDDATGTYDNENASNDVGTVIFKRYFTPSAIVGKTIYWADQGGYGYFRFTSDGKFYGTGNINLGESAENGPGTYTVEDRGVVSFQIPSVGSGTDTFLSNNFAGEYWRVQLLSGTYERWFYGANAAAEAQAFYLSGVAP